MNSTKKRNSEKVQMLVDAGLVKPDMAKLIEITGMSKRAIYYWILEDNDGVISDKVSKQIENKIIDYTRKEAENNEPTDYAMKKISDALGF